MSRDHRVARGPTLHVRRPKRTAKPQEKFDLACTCGESFAANTAKDVLRLWRRHRRAHQAEEALS